MFCVINIVNFWQLKKRNKTHVASWLPQVSRCRVMTHARLVSKIQHKNKSFPPTASSNGPWRWTGLAAGVFTPRD